MKMGLKIQKLCPTIRKWWSSWERRDYEEPESVEVGIESLGQVDLFCVMG